MATTPPAAANAPVLDDSVDGQAERAAAPKGWRQRLSKLSLRAPAFLAKLPLPQLKLSKKALMILIGACVVGVAGVGAALYALQPVEPERPRAPAAKKPKRVKHAASAPSVPASTAAAASAVVEAPATAASGPEEAMDRLQRRLGEVMGAGGKLQAAAPGEWHVTAKTGTPVTLGEKAPRRAGAASNGEHVAHAQAPVAARSDKAAPARASGHANWSYEGPHGPQAWSRLSSEYAKCASGTRQSPIDLRDGIQVDLDPVKFEYQPSRFSVIDNGHTVQVNVASGNFIEVMGRRFELQQFHFHRPSEERIDGRQFDMVAHLVHKDGQGRLAVVAVLLERGSAQSLVQTVWNNLPLEKEEEQVVSVPIDLNQLLPTERGYFTYMGSLTTPPCSEGVLWMVMKRPVSISAEQLAIFGRLYPMNARPLQAASGRLIKESK